MSKDLLLEIGTEEIPSIYIRDAISGMKPLAEKLFTDNKISYDSVNIYATPRRLTLYAKGVSEKQGTIEEKLAGPPFDRAYDKDGSPTKAAEGFANRNKVSLDDIKTEDTDKGKYTYIIKKSGGEETSLLLKKILPEYINNLHFPKTMRWGTGETRFVRPIHWILSLFGEETLRFNLGDIESSNTSRGHRFLSKGAFTADNPDDYFIKLKNGYVLLDQEERKALIVREITKAADLAGGVVVSGNELTDIVSFLTEYPVAVTGRFDPKFLILPKELLITVMNKHQRYFPVQDKDGNLLPCFITISNITSDRIDIIAKGNERVLSARLSDAFFFMNEDRKKDFSCLREKLDTVLFQETLGSIGEKVNRITALSIYIANCIDKDLTESAERAASLCKNDLVTHVVYEFPTLQGIMGREYAKISGEKEEVSDAIFEHYLPRFAKDILPGSIYGAIVGIADRLDTITGCFGAGLIPTGSNDPYALRRQGLAITNIILDKKIDIDLYMLIDYSTTLLLGRLKREACDINRDVIEFIRSRVAGQLEEDGFSYDVINSVIYTECSNIVETRKKIAALSSFKKDSVNKDFNSLIIAYKRITNILSSQDVSGSVDPDIFNAPCEKGLFESFQGIAEKVDAELSKRDYSSALSNLATIRPAVDTFFNEVLVMDKDIRIRENRLRLLKGISEIFKKIADISRIVT